jgi:hypothetical protein
MVEPVQENKTRRWANALAAVLVGNAVYFAFSPRLPEHLQHKPFQIDIGLAVDFLICAAAYLLLVFSGRSFGRN